MMDNPIWIMFIALFFKHFVVDFLMQKPYQYLNKGTYGHPGGILHAGLHIVGTLVVLGFHFGFSWLLLALAVGEGIAHYHIDWGKMNLCKWRGWEPTNSEQFWWALGFDQYLHYLTYAVMVAIYFNG